MEDYFSRRPPLEAFHTVQDPAQARLLTNPKTRPFFEPFLAREQTVSAAAKDVGCTLHAMLYRVKTFVEAGLLRVVREEPRAGRPVKHYRSTFDAYFIPHGVTPYANLEDALLEQTREQANFLVRQWAKLLHNIGHDGRRFYRDPYGEINWESGEVSTVKLDFDNPTYPAAFDFSLEIRLSKEEAKALQLELRDLYLRYLPARAQPSGGDYVFQAALVPVVSE